MQNQLQHWSLTHAHTHKADKDVTQAFAFIKPINTADLVCCNTVYFLGSVHVTPFF